MEPDLCSYNFHQRRLLIKSLEPCTRGQSKCLDYTLNGAFNHTNPSLRFKTPMPLVISQMYRGMFDELQQPTILIPANGLTSQMLQEASRTLSLLHA
jgi:hypothetical protein